MMFTAAPKPRRLTLRQECLKWYRQSLEEGDDRFNVRATAAAASRGTLTRGIALPTEIWDEIGLVLAESAALSHLRQGLAELMMLWTDVCILELDGDTLLDGDGHGIRGINIVNLREHLALMDEARRAFREVRQPLTKLAKRLRRNDLMRQFGKDMWGICALVQHDYAHVPQIMHSDTSLYSEEP